MNWTEICPTGLDPWLNPAANDTQQRLSPCFQKLCLQIPLLVLFVIGSAHEIGFMLHPRGRRWQRDAQQLRAIRLRLAATAMLIALPLIRYVLYAYLSASSAAYWPVNVWTDVVELLTYSVHFVYLRSTLSGGQRSHRLPMALSIVWITLYVLSAVSVTDPQWSAFWPVICASICLHSLYAVSLVWPAGWATEINVDDVDDDELLITDAGSHRHPHCRPLGKAIAGANIWSRFTFGWVNTLIDKGLTPELGGNGSGLRTVDDLYELPDVLDVDRLSNRLQDALRRSPRLLWALHRAHGWEFYGIGVLRLFADVGGLAGPVLLGGLLTHGTTVNQRRLEGLEDDSFDATPYWFAFGLFASTLICE